MMSIVIMIFVAVFLAVCTLCLSVQAFRESPAAELKRRLRRMAANRGTGIPEAFTSELLRDTGRTRKFFNFIPLSSIINKRIEQSGTHITPLSFVLLSGIAAFSGFIIVYALSRKSVTAFLVMLLFGVIPYLYLLYCKQQRQKLFDEQLPDALTMVARSLRAGHSLPGAIELISQEMPEPTGGLFRIAYDQQQLGMRMTDSLSTLLERIESIDLNYFVTIIRINSETGGNLAEILDKLADTVRSRLQIRRQVKVYSAQGRLSGYILTALPVVVFVAFNFLNPAYMNVFYTEQICQFALFAALLAQIAGFVMIRKIVDIRI